MVRSALSGTALCMKVFYSADETSIASVPLRAFNTYRSPSMLTAKTVSNPANSQAVGPAVLKSIPFATESTLSSTRRVSTVNTHEQCYTVMGCDAKICRVVGMRRDAISQPWRLILPLLGSS